MPSGSPNTRSVVGGLVFALALFASARASAADERKWCAPEAEEIQAGVCFYEPVVETGHAPETDSSKTLVLFLHSLVGAKSDWQWEQQRVLMRAARRYGFATLMPRGRKGIGPGRAPDVWAWPTSARAQDEVEDELVLEWRRAQSLVEERTRQPFERLLVFGFSNGAYYATSLALRNRIDADGYGVFAGGNGGKYSMLLGSRTSKRAPIFVGFGTKDPARKDMRSLGDTLKALGWRHRVKSEPVGHIVTDAQLQAAMVFLSPRAPGKVPP